MKKIRQFSRTNILQATALILSNLLCKFVYMEDVKYVNLVKISPVVIETRGIEYSDLAAPVNNTLVYSTSFMAADT